MEKNGAEARLSYEERPDYLDFYHVYVDPSIRNEGCAARITDHALEYAKNKGLKVRATCPFVVKHLSRNRALWRDIRQD